MDEIRLTGTTGVPDENDMVHGYDVDTGEEIVVPASLLPDKRTRVPLVIYIGDEKRIIGDAVVEGNNVEAYIHPKGGETLGELAESGIIQSLSVAFNAPPAIPVVRDDGKIRWKKSY